MIVEPENLPAEGRHEAVIKGVTKKNTRKGLLSFWLCELNDGGNVEVLIPQKIKENTHIHRFLKSILGTVETGQEINPEVAIEEKAVVTIKHIARGNRVYANGIKIQSAKQFSKEEF